MVPPRVRPPSVLLVLLAAATLAAGVAAQSTTSSDTPPPQDHEIIVTTPLWSPQELVARVGDTVTWLNNGTDRHYILKYGDEVGSYLEGTRPVTIRLDRPGEFVYYCYEHAGVRNGRVIGAERLFIRVVSGRDTGPNDPPKVEITRPANGTLVWGVATIEGRVSDPDGVQDLSRVAIRVDGGPWTNLGGEVTDDSFHFVYRWNAQDAEVGPHVIDVRAMDRGLSVRTNTIDVEVPAGPPQDDFYGNVLPRITLESPHDGSRLSDPTVVRGTASDATPGLALVEVRFDEGPWIRANGTANWFVPLDPLRLGTGAHVVEARAFDGLDFSDTASAAFTVVAPVPAYTGPPPAATSGDGKGAPGPAALLVLAAAAGAAWLVRRR